NNYSDSLTASGTTATWTTSDGHQYNFTALNGTTHTYTSPANLFGTLSVSGTVGALTTVFTYTDTKGLKHIFTVLNSASLSLAQLTAIRDRNDNELDVSYDGSHRLSAVTDSQNSSEHLTFGYSGSSTDIGTVTDPSGRQWSYCYTTQSGKNYLSQ